MASAIPEVPPLRFLVAVDGSAGSRLAFDIAVSFAKRGDSLTVLHVATGDETLPHEMQPTAIQTHYEVQCVTRFPTGKWAVQIKDRHQGLTTRQSLQAYLTSKDHPEFDILVIGFTGRKGPKADPTICGSSTDMSLRGVHVSTCIAKRKGEIAPSGHRTFVVGADGSDRAHKGVELALRLSNPDDTVVVAHVDEGSSDISFGRTSSRRFDKASVEARYTAFAALQPPGRLRAVTVRRGEPISPVLPASVGLVSPGPSKHSSVARSLVDLASDLGAALLIVGIDGLGAFAAGKPGRLGSTSDAVVREAPCSVLVVQPGDFSYSEEESSSAART